jgi:hypothetical protein
MAKSFGAFSHTGFWIDKDSRLLRNAHEIRPIDSELSKRKKLMRRVLILVVILGIGMSSQASARLGNNKEQVAALLGKPIEIGKPDSNDATMNTYESRYYIALVQFVKGYSVAEAYSRKDRGKLSEKELSVFLDGNSAGNKWTKTPSKKPAWTRSDHRADASYQTLAGRPTLLIQAHY